MTRSSYTKKKRKQRHGWFHLYMTAFDSENHEQLSIIEHANIEEQFISLKTLRNVLKAD